MNDTLINMRGTVQEDIGYILGLSDMSDEEQQQFMEAVGVLVIESAVTKFIISVLPGERAAFEFWLETHRQDNELLERAIDTYPLFAEILKEEIDVFQEEAKRLFSVRQ